MKPASLEVASVVRYLGSAENVQILNIQVSNISVSNLLAELKQGVVFTPNVDHLIKLQKDLEFWQVYQAADYRLCDSQVVLFSLRFLGTPVKERVSGSDFFPAFYNFHRNNPDVTIFLLGGLQGAPERAAELINKKIGRKIVVGAYSPPFGFENDEQECQLILDKINQSGATVLAVGVGAPKQEKWIHKFKQSLPGVKIFLAIGATINFEAGVVKRAPIWMSQIGLEWLFRLVAEPGRLWKRYFLDDLPCFWLLLKQKFGLYENPWSSQDRCLKVGSPLTVKAALPLKDEVQKL
jgi:exopolysaccharide biosynthesis WecB/TagA/CpsF family protein